MHNNAEFLSRFSSNAYEFDKSEMHFHLRKSVVTFAKKIYIYIYGGSTGFFGVDTSQV